MNSVALVLQIQACGANGESHNKNHWCIFVVELINDSVAILPLVVGGEDSCRDPDEFQYGVDEDA